MSLTILPPLALGRVNIFHLACLVQPLNKSLSNVSSTGPHSETKQKEGVVSNLNATWPKENQSFSLVKLSNRSTPVRGCMPVFFLLKKIAAGALLTDFGFTSPTSSC